MSNTEINQKDGEVINSKVIDENNKLRKQTCMTCGAITSKFYKLKDDYIVCKECFLLMDGLKKVIKIGTG